MSKIKTKCHPFFYEGMYWKSPACYVAWIESGRMIILPQTKSSIL